MASFTSTQDGTLTCGGGEDAGLEIVIADPVPLTITLESVDLDREEPTEEE
jgi:hypothetical protein